jgi:phthalate 4,5-dioxygenase reductase subunit
MSEALRLKVRAIAELTPRIRSFELVPLGRGEDLPAFTAGSHLTVHLPSGLERQYSLCNDPAERHRYVIAVQREEAGRGGSAEMFAAVHVGDVLSVGVPRNLFPLHDAGDEAAVLVAGGIGVTPILAMARHLAAVRRPFSVLYLARDPDAAAFLEDFAALASTGVSVTIHHDGGDPARGFDLGAFLAALPETAHVYCCGPAGLMAAVAALGAARGERMHFEHFANADAAPKSGDRAFVVTLARSGRDVAIPADRSILDTLLEAGLDIDYSCTEGTCGTCITRLLAGEADHRDRVLLPSERADHIVICCSRARGERLVLDL